MANRGVPLDEVFAAADALLAAGERPSVQRVRVALGRGSPNALAPVLERWWAQLARRLAQQQALPELPQAVAESFAAAWARALEAGHAHGEALVAPERAALAEALAKMDAVAAAHHAALAERDQQIRQLQTTSEAGQTALATSEARVADLQREVAALTKTATELGRQREAAEA